MKDRHEQYLLDITSIPTAAGKEFRVMKWIEAWAKRRRSIQLVRDRYGNLTINRKGVTSRRPIYFTAHLDHPAFVVTRVLDDGRHVEAEFLGGVNDDYFEDTAVAIWHGDMPAQRGRIISLDRRRGEWREHDQAVTARFSKRVKAEPGDVMTWALPKSRISRGRLHAPACDDLAAVAAAICAFEVLLSKPKHFGDVRMLFTRAEEVGFVGAMAAGQVTGPGAIPKQATLICLENSKSMVDSPIGGGPIVRVGDRISVFDPDLTAQLCAVAERKDVNGQALTYQRKLMPGGACEATAFRLMGYRSTCLCLPLGNYHNMDEAAGKIAPESIATGDYHGLIDLLVRAGRYLDSTPAQSDLLSRLNRRFDQRRTLISG
ncbi:MAG: M20/M25/M40 family metallo-hydrolase [Planctomycetota bacterium]